MNFLQFISHTIEQLKCNNSEIKPILKVKNKNIYRPVTALKQGSMHSFTNTETLTLKMSLVHVRLSATQILHP